MIVCILWLLLIFQQNVSCTVSNGTTVPPPNDSYNKCIPCHVVRIDVSIDGVDLAVLQANPIKCITKHSLHSYRTSYDIDLPESFLQAHQHIIDGGDALVCVRDAYIDESMNRIVMTTANDNRNNNTNDDDAFTVSSYSEFKATRQKQQKHRLLQQNHQEILLMVVRIIDVNGIEPMESIASIEGAIFGTGSNPDNISETASVVRHLASVTHDKVSLIPSDTIQTSGVIEVPIAIPVNGSGFFRELLTEILNATELVVGSMEDAADAYVFCLPDGASLVGQMGWTGFTVSLEPYSFFQRSYCTKLSAVIHELGHSIFGFSHSSKDGEEYGDISCYMGFLEDSLAYPLKAFNAHKHWLSGWFDDRTETVNRTELPWNGSDRRLVSFVDYQNEALIETDVALISVDDLYIQYDVPKGYNIDSLSRGNVLITQANDTLSRSFAVANLSIGQSFTYHKISDSDDATGIVIEVCNTGFANDTLDYSIISIFLNDGTQQSTCYSTENGTSSSTSPTLSLISTVPSMFYSSVPSEVPTSVPSMPNTISMPSARPILLPENETTYIPTPLRKTLDPSDVRSTLGPTANSSASETSGAYRDSGRILRRFTGTMELSVFFLATSIALQYFTHWMIVQI